MSTFHREIQVPLNAIENQLGDTLKKPTTLERLTEFSIQLIQIQERLGQFQARAMKPDSPYGDQMREKIFLAATTAEKLLQTVNSDIESLASSHPTERSGPDRVASPVLSTVSVRSALDSYNPGQAASQLSRIREAFHVLNERESKLKIEAKARQAFMADTERQKRNVLREREQAEAQRIKQEAADDLAVFNSLITLGHVNHVKGVDDLAKKMKSCGTRACIVDWFAPWCGPCRMVAPLFERLAAQHREIVFLTVDTEIQANKPLVHMHNIRALPTFEVMASGKLIKRIEGANMAALEHAILQANEIADEALLEETLRLSAAQDIIDNNPNYTSITSKTVSEETSCFEVTLVSTKGTKIGSLKLNSYAMVSDLFREVTKIVDGVVAITFNGRVLDSKNDEMLFNIGFSEQTQVRVLTKVVPLQINIKVGEKITPIQFRPSSSVLDLRHEARLLTNTNDPKLVYLGRLLSTDQNENTLTALRLSSNSTVLCIPSGPPVRSNDIPSNLVEESPATPVYEAKDTAKNRFAGLMFADSTPLWNIAIQRFEAKTPLPEYAKETIASITKDGNLLQVVNTGLLPSFLRQSIGEKQTNEES